MPCHWHGADLMTPACLAERCGVLAVAIRVAATRKAPWSILRRRRYPLSAPGRQPGQPRLIEDFFTEEYAQPPDPQLPQALSRLHGWHRDGWRMGISQGRALRIVTEHQDGHARNRHWLVSGRGWRLFRVAAPGHVGEYLALTGNVINGARCGLGPG